MNKTAVLLGSNDTLKLREMIGGYVADHMLYGDAPFRGAELLSEILEALPIEDLYSRSYLIATGEALAKENT